MLYLFALILTAAFCIIGAHRRWRDGGDLDGAYLSKLASVSAGLGVGIGLGALPTTWILVSYAIYGGSVESNLPPGLGTGYLLLGFLVIAAPMALVYPIVGYRDHVFPYRIVQARMRDLGPNTDVEPLQRGPEDSPE